MALAWGVTGPVHEPPHDLRGARERPRIRVGRPCRRRGIPCNASERSPAVTTWSPDELERIGRATELQVASRRSNGSLRPYVTIWAVGVGDELYVRSAHGPTNGWYRRAKAAGAGRIRAGGVERDVSFEEPARAVARAVTAAYH